MVRIIYYTVIIMRNPILKTNQTASKDATDPSVAFVVRFGRALHRYGLASNRIEDALTAVASRLGSTGQFFATPTAIFASLDHNGDNRTVLIRVEPGDVNLEKLSRLDELLRSVISGRIHPADALRSVDEIDASRPRFGPVHVVAGFALASATASRFFGGGWREFIVCGLIGLCTGALATQASRSPGRFRVFEPLAAFLAGAIAAGATILLDPMSVFVATCAGLIVLIPGLTLTMAMSELATRNLAAGTVRLGSATLVFLQIAFGVAVGLRVGEKLFGAHMATPPAALPDWTLAPALLLAAAAFTILFQARLRDMGWIAAAGALSYVSARVGSELGGAPEIGAFVGALTLGLASNLHARLLNRPASVTLVPGIVLLVPGSVGFQSLSSLIAKDVVNGMEMAFTMGMIGVALVTGLLLAGAIIMPKRSL